jgi:hypothetical protein
MQLSVNQLQAGILSADLNPEDYERLRRALSMSADKKKRSFKRGDRVMFKSSRTGEEVHGVVIKLGPKNVMIDVNGGEWRVSPQLVTKVTTSVSSDSSDAVFA